MEQVLITRWKKKGSEIRLYIPPRGEVKMRRKMTKHLPFLARTKKTYLLALQFQSK
jgi:hypothetical protein